MPRRDASRLQRALVSWRLRKQFWCVVIVHWNMQIQSTTERLPGEPAGQVDAQVHNVALLDRARYLIALLPRIPLTSTIAGIVTQVWDAQRSSDIFIECASVLIWQACVHSIQSVHRARYPSRMTLQMLCI